MKYFIGKVKDTNVKGIDEKDVVYYIEFEDFEYNHDFRGFRLKGACFSGFEKEFKQLFDEGKIESILTTQDIEKLYDIDNKLAKLGFGIEKDSDRYKQGINLLKELDSIKEKLESKENEQLFNKVIEEEKNWCMSEYNLSRSDVDYIFNEYNEIYQDRNIIFCVYNDFDDMVESEKWFFGYENTPYFDGKAFGEDLLQSGNHIELEDGRIVYLSYCTEF